MKLLAIVVTIVIAANVAFAQSPPTLRIVTEDPNLPSELFYGNIKVKPLRLRPGTNQVLTFEDNDYFVFQQYVDFLLRMPDTGGFNDWLTVLNNCGPNQGKLGSSYRLRPRPCVVGLFPFDRIWRQRLLGLSFLSRPARLRGRCCRSGSPT